MNRDCGLFFLPYCPTKGWVVDTLYKILRQMISKGDYQLSFLKEAILKQECTKNIEIRLATKYNIAYIMFISPPNSYTHRKPEVPGSKCDFTARWQLPAVNGPVYCTEL